MEPRNKRNTNHWHPDIPKCYKHTHWIVLAMVFENFLFKFPICHFLDVYPKFLPVLGFSAIEGPRNSRNQHRHGRHCWYVDAGRSFDQPGGQCSCKCVNLPETTLGCHMLLKYTLVEVVKLYVSGQIIVFFTNLDFPDIRGFPFLSYLFGGPGRVRSL